MCSKLAARERFLSPRFLLLYCGMLLILFVYALCWQQIIKKIPLTTAYLNKAVSIPWGILWGMLIFGEQVSLRMLIGAVIVIAGVVLVVKADE